MTLTIDTLPLKHDHWSQKHLTRPKGGGPLGTNAWWKRRWGARGHFKVAVAAGKMGDLDDDLDGEFEADEEIDWDEFYASE